jgi:hypothetical protein
MGRDPIRADGGRAHDVDLGDSLDRNAAATNRKSSLDSDLVCDRVVDSDPEDDEAQTRRHHPNRSEQVANEAVDTLKKCLLLLNGPTGVVKPQRRHQLFHELKTKVIHTCRSKRKQEVVAVEDVSDERLFKLARYTDRYNLQYYCKLLAMTPRVVNVVSLAEALPCPKSNKTLPLDLHAIASRCSNSFFAPRRFSAVMMMITITRLHTAACEEQMQES